MVIKPTLLIGLGKAGSLIAEKSYEQLIALNPLLKNTVDMVGLDDEGTMRSIVSGTTVFEKQVDGNGSYSSNYSALIQKESEIYYYLVSIYDQLNSLRTSKLLIQQGIELGNFQVILVSSLYDKVGSVAVIPFLRIIEKFNTEKDVVGFERHCIGLMPDLESNIEKIQSESSSIEAGKHQKNIYARTYAALCEIDSILTDPKYSNLLSSFFFISNRNIENRAIGSLEEVTPTVGIYCNMLIRSELANIYSSKHMYKPVQGKDPHYGSFGLSSIVYPVEKFVASLIATSTKELLEILVTKMEGMKNRNEINSAIIDFLADVENAKLTRAINKKNDQGEEIYHDFTKYLGQKYSQEEMLENTNVEKFIEEIKIRLKDYGVSIFNGQYVPLLTQRRITLTQTLVEKINAKYIGYIADKDGVQGISYAHGFLSLLTKTDSKYLDGEILGESQNLDNIEEKELQYYKAKVKIGNVDPKKLQQLETEIQNKESYIKKLKEDSTRAEKKSKQSGYEKIEIISGKYFNVAGKKTNINGYLPDDKSADLKPYQSSGISLDQIPQIVDLRPLTTTVEEQAEVGSCTANAIAGAYEFLAKRNTGKLLDISRLFIYYNARLESGTEKEDSGCSLGVCTKVLMDKGACFEKTWPYDTSKIFEKPPQLAYDEALNFKIDDASRIPIDLQTLKQCLAEGYPFVFGLKLFNSFFDDQNIVIPVPSKDENQSKEHGNHAMLCVGYSDKDKVFIVRNSWGVNWRDRGHCYIPYEYLANEDFCHECVQIKSVTDEVEIDTKIIWKQDGSLFNKVVSQAKRESLDETISQEENNFASLITEYTTLKKQQELLDNQIKDPNFRNNIIETELHEIDAQIEKTIKDLSENENNLRQKNARYDELLFLRDKWGKRLIIFYPLGIIVFLAVFFGFVGYETSYTGLIEYVFEHRDWFLSLFGALLVIYPLWAYVKYMKMVGTELKQVSIELKELKNRKVNLLLQCIRQNASQYTVRFEHTVHSYLLDLLREVNGWIDEQIEKIEIFISSILSFKKQKEDFLGGITFDDNIFLNSVVTNEDIQTYRIKKDIFHEFFSPRGKGPFLGYFQEFLKSKDLALLRKDLDDYFIEAYSSIKEKTIYDMILKEPTIIERCTPEIRIKLLVDAAQPYWHSSMVKGEDMYCLNRWKNDNEDVLSNLFETNGISFGDIIDSENKNIITLLSVKNGIPAFDSSLLSECHSVFLDSLKSGQTAADFFIDEKYVNDSFIPMGIIYRNQAILEALIQACAMKVITTSDDGLYIKKKKLGDDFYHAYEFLASLKGENDLTELQEATSPDYMQSLDKIARTKLIKEIEDYRKTAFKLFSSDKLAEEVINKLLKKLV